jgi:hypothetical protein
MLHILRLRLTYLSGACFIAFRCVHPYTGKKACSLWCGYRIVYCAIPFRDPSLIHVSLFVIGTLSLFQSGVCHIHDHGTPLRCTFTASCICGYCSGSASCPMLHKFRKIQAHFVCTTSLYPHLPQFILYIWWQPCGCIWWYSHMIASKLISLHGHHITPVLTICTAATVNSYFIVWLLLGACFLRHCQSSRLYNLTPCVRTSHLLYRA